LGAIKWIESVNLYSELPLNLQYCFINIDMIYLWISMME